MSYFTAVIAGNGRAWRARDVDVEDAESLDDLADILRGVSHGGNPVLAVIEREDEWFALVRVDGDDDPRVFVSDLPAASRGPFAELLASAADIDTPDADADADTTEEADAGPGPDAAPDDSPTPAAIKELPPRDQGTPAPRSRNSEPAIKELPSPGGVATAGGVEELDLLLDAADADGEVPDMGDLEDPDPAPPPAWAGDATLLDDLGVDRRRLCALTEDNTDDPAAVLAEIGEQVGFADLLEALR